MDILLRFHIHRAAVIADIEKAFLMVSVSKEDRDALRFLWVHDINAQLPRLVIMRFTRVVFGVSASPFLLNATIRSMLKNTEMKIHSSWINSIALSMWTILPLGPRLKMKPLSCSRNQDYAWTRQDLRFESLCLTLWIFRLVCHLRNTRHQYLAGRQACEDESYTKNTLGERLDHPECVKVLVLSEVEASG